MRLTKKRVKELHTELWLWLAENPDSEKTGWPRWKGNGGNISYVRAGCFPCEYTVQGENRLCCCLEFPGKMPPDDCLGGLYDKWCEATGKARTALAKQIAELPIRKRR